MAKVAGLGHVGLFVSDMATAVDFYTKVLGLRVTDRAGSNVVFLSARPDAEHHELVLGYSADQRTNARQMSFTVASLEDLKEIHARIVAAGCTIELVANHGIAIGCYFLDPLGNKVEVYWSTGIDYPQPFVDPVDLGEPIEILLQKIEQLGPRPAVREHFYGTNVGKRIVERAAH